MRWVRLRGVIGKSMVGLAAVGLWPSPLPAQQLLPRMDLGAAEEGAGPQAAEKEVTLAADGSFRAAVLTRSGELVAGARLTFKPRQSNLGPVVNAITSPAGITVVTGTKAGLYDAHVEAPQGVYDGTLRVMTMTDQEKQEMRLVDERARQILERTETLSPERLMKLHGAARSLRRFEGAKR